MENATVSSFNVFAFSLESKCKMADQGMMEKRDVRVAFDVSDSEFAASEPLKQRFLDLGIDGLSAASMHRMVWKAGLKTLLAASKIIPEVKRS